MAGADVHQEATVSTPPRLRPGYCTYKPPPLKNIDCPKLRTIDEHARYLARLVGTLAPTRTNPDVPPGVVALEWSRVRQWLEMAAGLRFVDVERLENDQSTWMCSSAAKYNEAHNNLASDYATEQMRLHYIWSAVERLLEVIDLPTVPQKEANRRYNRAGLLLTQSFARAEVPEHYECVLRHLFGHATGDSGLSADRPLQRAFEKAPWRSGVAMLLAAGNALRNIPAHGDATVPEAADWGDESDDVDQSLPAVLHAPRLGARGLLLSLQMLLSQTSAYDDQRDLIAPIAGWWTCDKDGRWSRDHEPDLTRLLLTAQLKPPYADDDLEDEIDEDGEPAHDL